MRHPASGRLSRGVTMTLALIVALQLVGVSILALQGLTFQATLAALGWIALDYIVWTER